MKYNVDSEFMTKCFMDIVSVDSPVGFYVKLNPVLENYAKKFGKKVTYDNKSTAYITLEGEDNSKTVLIGAHADTLGLMVKKIDSNGMLKVRPLGSVNFANLEGENVTVHTREGVEYTGLLTCKSHSVHVFDDARTLERNEDNMVVILDSDVKNDKEVRALGIEHGDYVFIEPRCAVTENGYIKSRFIDDKGSIACVFTMLKYLTENNLKPKYKTILAFPYGEEIGIGGTYVPDGVSEYVAVDIGLIGPDYNGNEHTVSICAKDASITYDYELTNRLINYAKKAECDYAVDVYYRYGSDAGVAVRAGNNLKNAVLGMAVYCSHGRERTHISGMENTVNLLLAYVLDI